MSVSRPTLIEEESDNLNPAEKLHATPVDSESDSESDSEDGKIHLISEGAYGCIYHPGISCRGTKENRNYITKIQKNTEITENEKKVSDIIQSKIRRFDHYFAPIVKQCNVSIARKYVADIKKCQVFKDDSESKIGSSTYVSNKVRYLGSENLQDYLHAVAEKPAFWRILINTHIRMMDAIKLLVGAKIIHMDIKPANVMAKQMDRTVRPIVIDFGISIDLTKFNIKKAFYIYDTYTPWCIDVVLCNYAVHKVADPATQPVSSASIDEVLNVFMYGSKSGNTPKHTTETSTKNGAFGTTLVSLDDTAIFVESLRGYFKTTYIDQPATWGQLYNDMITRHSSTWDNYGVSMMYMGILEFIKSASPTLFETIEMVDDGNILIRYLAIVRSVVYSTPAERPSVDATWKSLVGLLAHVQSL